MLSKPWHFRVESSTADSQWKEVGRASVFQGRNPTRWNPLPYHRRQEDWIVQDIPGLIPFHRRFALRRGFFGCLGYGAFGGLKAAEGWGTNRSSFGCVGLSGTRLHSLRFISQNQPNIPKPMPTMMGPNELYQEKHCTLVDKASTLWVFRLLTGPIFTHSHYFPTFKPHPRAWIPRTIPKKPPAPSSEESSSQRHGRSATQVVGFFGQVIGKFLKLDDTWSKYSKLIFLYIPEMSYPEMVVDTQYICEENPKKVNQKVVDGMLSPPVIHMGLPYFQIWDLGRRLLKW